MKKMFILLWIMVVLFFVSACSLSSNQRGKNESVRVLKNDMEFGNYKKYQWNKEISFPFPSPEAKSYEVSDSNGVFCKGTTKADFNNYLEVLKNDGWEELDNSIEGGYQPIYYILIKDNPDFPFHEW